MRTVNRRFSFVAKISVVMILAVVLLTSFKKTETSMTTSACRTSQDWFDICLYDIEGNMYVASYCLRGENSNPYCPGVPPPDEP